MLWEVIQDQVSGPTPILTRGNCRRWAQAALHRGRNQISTPLLLEAEFLLLELAKQKVPW